MRVYFAHPCFTDGQREFKELFLAGMSAALRGHMVLVDPFEHTPLVEGPDRDLKVLMAGEIKSRCLMLLDECDVLIALADDADTGTAFEMGYAHAIGKPVILISRGDCREANAMLIGAAEAMIDNVLVREQIQKLVRVLQELDGTQQAT